MWWTAIETINGHVQKEMFLRFFQHHDMKNLLVGNSFKIKANIKNIEYTFLITQIQKQEIKIEYLPHADTVNGFNDHLTNLFEHVPALAQKILDGIKPTLVYVFE